MRIDQVGFATALSGFHEDDVAAIFALFSRSTSGLKAAIRRICPSAEVSYGKEDRLDHNSRDFHNRVTIGYGDKSVGDHAMTHWALEGVSMIAERDILSGRLLAATAVSSRYVNMAEQGFVVPFFSKSEVAERYSEHCNGLIEAYKSAIPIAVELVRHASPPTSDWTDKAWETGTEKRALDMVRDLLPMSVKTSFGVSQSATAATEFFKKREAADTEEVRVASSDARMALSRSMPSLIRVDDGTEVKRHQSLRCTEYIEARHRFGQPMRIKIEQKPDWSMVSRLLGEAPRDLIVRWTRDRPHKMGPCREAEMVNYVISGKMPIGIYRDLGRHRMMTQLYGKALPSLGFGLDPLLEITDSPAATVLRALFKDALMKASDFFDTYAGVPSHIIEYASPMATHVPFVWSVNLRQLVYMIGLRTTRQGHAGYRAFAQGLARAIACADPVSRPLVYSATNFDDVIVARR